MNEKEILRLASLVGTDAKNPEEKLLAFIRQNILAVLREGIKSKKRLERWTVMTSPVVDNEAIAYNEALKDIEALLQETLGEK